MTQLLKAVATSSSYGAPQHELSAPTKNERAAKAARPANDSNALHAAVGSVSGSGDNHIYWLLAAMIVVTTTMVWAAARRHSV